MKKDYSPTKMLRKDKPDAFSAVLLGICLCFYLFFAFYDGAVICVDSPGYISTVSYTHLTLPTNREV